MDTIFPSDDAEADRLLRAKAVQAALQNITPGRPHALVRLEMLNTTAELDKEIERRLAE